MNVCTHPGPGYLYIDESNRAITDSARPLCRACYTSRYGIPSEFRRPTDFDLYRITDGVLGVHHVLLSGDHCDRRDMRARFTVVMTAAGSRVSS